MEVFCKNRQCMFHKFTEKHLLKRGRIVNQFDSDFYDGKCSCNAVRVSESSVVKGDSKYHCSECGGIAKTEKVLAFQTVFCDAGCVWNSSGVCTKDEIGIDKNSLGSWVCKNQSDTKFSGHIDFSRFPQGGHIDDDYAEKLNADKAKFKSFGGGP